jgi:hypothetical protein
MRFAVGRRPDVARRQYRTALVDTVTTSCGSLVASHLLRIDPTTIVRWLPPMEVAPTRLGVYEDGRTVERDILHFSRVRVPLDRTS